MLQEISRRLQGVLRGETVSRVGGDDFFIVLESFDDEKNIDIVVANILSALKKSIVDERASEFLVMEAELKQAILAEELYLQYQPQFDLSDNSLVGMEALVRWKHPVKGIVPPGDFIFLAEETGLILPLGEWVLREACRQISQWLAEDLNVVPVAVNVSKYADAKRGLY